MAMNTVDKVLPGILLDESGYPFTGICPPLWVERVDAFFAGQPIRIIVNPEFRLSANLCRRIGDVDLYHQWIHNALANPPSPWWAAAFATTTLVGYFSAGKSLLDACSVALNHLYVLDLKPKEQDFSKGRFWNKLQATDSVAYQRLSPHRPFIDKVVRWRDVSVHRLPPRVRVLHDGPPTKTPEATTMQDVHLGITGDTESDMFEGIIGKKLTWVDPLKLVNKFTQKFHSFASDVAEMLLTKLGSDE